jgi:hypothetical protein
VCFPSLARNSLVKLRSKVKKLHNKLIDAEVPFDTGLCSFELVIGLLLLTSTAQDKPMRKRAKTGRSFQARHSDEPDEDNLESRNQTLPQVKQRKRSRRSFCQVKSSRVTTGSSEEV